MKEEASLRTELQMRAFAESCGKLFMEDVCPQPAA